MIICKDDEGRVVLMASERGMRPILRGTDNLWGPALVSGKELDEFTEIDDPAEREALLNDGLARGLVHYVGWAGQPYVEFACTKEGHYVHIAPEHLPKSVYRSDGGLYTFVEDLSTCLKCLESLK